ncbi:diacylglycerol kinase family protein [Acidothermaceae bacterium B102]|nr:diacylglycerol kinase family protein [Acidothermaceae bacterium B102]
MRAVLIVNPKATATTHRGRDVLARALASDLKLDVVETTHRGHAAEIAAEAVRDELDLVVTLGGDGTVNEAVNGLMTGDGPRPAYAVVPGGSANVFSRGLGLPADPVEATSALLEALRAGRRRTISLGSVNGRYFSFCAGIGYDAEVTGMVEGRRRDGARSTPGLYVRSAVRHFYDGSDRASLTSAIEGESPIDGLQMVVVSNTSPWTYWGSRPLRPSPEASFETGLDVYAMRKMRLVPTLRALSQMASSKAEGPRGRSIHRRHDLSSFVLTASSPAALEVDGDYVGEFDRFELLSVPHALTVIS